MYTVISLPNPISCPMEENMFKSIEDEPFHSIFVLLFFKDLYKCMFFSCSQEADNGLHPGIIAAIVIGCVLFVVIVIAIIAHTSPERSGSSSGSSGNVSRNSLTSHL